MLHRPASRRRAVRLPPDRDQPASTLEALGPRLRDRDRDADQTRAPGREDRARADRPALPRHGQQAPTAARHDAHMLSRGALPLLSRAISVTGIPDAPKWHATGLNNGPIVAATYYGVSHLPTWVTYN